jgi:hypothetical protein
MSAPILQRGDWVFLEFPAKADRYGVLDDEANRHTAAELTKGFNAHGVMVQGWICSTAIGATRVVAVFRDPPPVVIVKDVIPE